MQIDTGARRVARYIPRRNGFKKGSKVNYSRVPRPMKRTNYDGIYYAKLNGTFPVIYNTLGSCGAFSVAWG